MKNVGIGETSPLGKLHIKGSDTGATASAQGNSLILEDTENGLSILSSTAGAGYINFGDSDDNDVGMIIYGHSSNSMSFWTNASQRMRIDSSGRVGIGTSSPDTLLHLSDTSGNSILRLERNDTSIAVSDVYGSIEFEGQDASAGSSGVRGSISGIAESTTGGMGIAFSTAPSGGSNTEVMRIDRSGNVGIGSTSPDANLEVIGSYKQKSIRFKLTGFYYQR